LQIGWSQDEQQAIGAYYVNGQKLLSVRRFAEITDRFQLWIKLIRAAEPTAHYP
jgi:hypothetical protein